MKKIKKIMFVVMAFTLLISDLGIPKIVKAAAGDDPGVTITSPDSINSKGLVNLDVTLSTSAGKITEDGMVTVKIPKNIVLDPSQLETGLIFTNPFYIESPAYSDDGEGNYILNVKYDASKIDPNNANGYKFTVEFRAPFFSDHTEITEEVIFEAELDIGNSTVSVDSDSSKTNPSSLGNPMFEKYGNAPSVNVGDGLQYIMSPTASGDNNFVLIFNYNHQTYNDVTITDDLPEGLSLADTYSIFPTATGNSERVKHLYIYKVSVDDSGKVTNPQYVTDKFMNDIQATEKGFSVHLGKVDPTESYAITYGASVNEGYTSDNFGVQYNHAILSENDSQINEQNIPLIMDNTTSSATSLNKKVEQESISTNDAELVYSLTLKNNSGQLKAGTVVSDPLPDYVSYLDTLQNTGFSDVSYDKSTNTASYTLLENLNPGESREIKLKVKYFNPEAHIGDSIINKASYTYAGSTIYSNDAVTILSGSAKLIKVDNKTKDILAGAVFKVVNSKGEVVAKDLYTDANGEVTSGLLAPGDYAFVETQAPDGYALDTTPNPFKVVSGQNSAVTLEMYNSQAIQISGTKTWVDDDNTMGLRPELITINLYQNNKKIKSAKIGEKNKWKYTFEGLPKYNNLGEEYSYRVEEEKVKYYEMKQNGFDFTNTLVYSEKPKVPENPESSEKKSDSSQVKEKSDDLPSTGVKSTIFITLLGLVIILGVVTISKKINRK
ncbi:Cna B-type domain-containing protein [Lactococcus garvieae]|uniref:Cna B-type domain-containing protein n=1 Tax=Lactococcus garvieae TaxID=1363 RepID=UPI001F6234E9|nr:Cna B-type domain-containing protein [Lactococcus garvieae]MCI3860396.1 Cna B-type domain-containing protein [Lactococcus garvieae]